MRHLLLLLTLTFTLLATDYETWYYPQWASKAKYNKPLTVKDTDSALGRYNVKTKAIDLKTLTIDQK